MNDITLRRNAPLDLRRRTLGKAPMWMTALIAIGQTLILGGTMFTALLLMVALS